VQGQLPPDPTPASLQVVQGDGRLFLQRSRGRFDLVVLDLPPPVTLQLNRFYSQEGLAALSRALAPGGVAVLALAGPGEGLGRLQARQLGSLMAAARASFGQVLPLWGPELLLFCAKEPGALAEDAQTWRERLAQRDWPGVSAVRDDLLAEGLAPWRRRQLMETLELTGPHAPNRDLRPLALLYDPQLWGVQLEGQGAWAAALAGVGFWPLALPLSTLAALLAGLARWRRRSQDPGRPALGWGMLITGATSMAWSLLLITAWQAFFGSLYLGLALLLGSFMLGLGLASLLGAPRLAALERPGAWLALGHWALALACLATLGLVHWLSILGTPGKNFQLLVLALAALDGGLTGAYFALAGQAGRQMGAGQGSLPRLGGALYGLDLAGGVLGALVPLVLVPSLGFDACLGLLALLNLTALCGLWRPGGAHPRTAAKSSHGASQGQAP
jgi:spermidine synthase